eukprot:3941263-Rhodomonas_salina.2
MAAMPSFASVCAGAMLPFMDFASLSGSNADIYAARASIFGGNADIDGGSFRFLLQRLKETSPFSGTNLATISQRDARYCRSGRAYAPTRAVQNVRY